MRLLIGIDADMHDVVDRLLKSKLTAAEVQAIYDKGFADGHSAGAEQGRRSAVIAAAMPMGMLDTSDVGPGVNGHGWFEIAQHCATNKDRIHRDKDREFVDSIYEQMTFRGKSPTSAAGEVAARYFQSAFWREDLMQPIIEVRFAMVTNGYTSIIPVIGKKPVLDQWEKTRNVSREMLETWSSIVPGLTTLES